MRTQNCCCHISLYGIILLDKFVGAAIKGVWGPYGEAAARSVYCYLVKRRLLPKTATVKNVRTHALASRIEFYAFINIYVFSPAPVKFRISRVFSFILLFLLILFVYYSYPQALKKAKPKNEHTFFLRCVRFSFPRLSDTN